MSWVSAPDNSDSGVMIEVLGKDAFPGKGQTRDEEVTALKRELAKVKKERDFLKEAAAYFAKEST